jgi:hypothetical protein
MIKILTEEEKSNISSQHDEIDRNLLNFLIRRIKIEKRKLGGNWGDIEPLEVTEYTFEGYPSYGFTSYDSKKTMENKIIRMLFENDIIKDVYDMDERDPKRIKIVKTIRNFLNFILKDKK